MEIFISRDGQQFGPYPIEQVRELLNQNVLLPDDLAYHEGLDNWVSLSDIAGITEVPTIPPLPPPTPQIDLVQTNERSSSPVTSTQSSVAPASTGQGRMVLAFVSVLLVLVGLGSVGIWFAFFNEKQSDSDANKASLTRAPGALSTAEVETLFADDIGTWNARGFSMATGEPPQDENLELIIEWDKQGASTICKFAPLINGERVPFVGKKKYDPQAGVFIWRSKGRDFPEGTSREKYDAKTKTYHGEATYPNGAKETSTHRIINQNRRYQKSQVVKDGKVVFIREAVLTRVLDNNSNKPSLLGNILAMALPTGSGDMPAEAASESMDSGEAHDHSSDHIGPETDFNATSLVAYYPFNGNARNEAGNDHHGQVFGAKLTADRHGKANSAYQFKPGDHIKIDGLMGKPKNLTLSAWVKLDGQQGKWGSEIISLGVSASIRVDSKSTYPQRVGTGGVTRMQQNGWMNTMAKFNYTGTGWHQIVFTFDDDANRQVTYIDGAQLALKENERSIVYQGLDKDTLIGIHGRSLGTFRTQGIIDDLRVYDRALTGEEVKALFRSEKPAFPLQAGNPIEVTSIAELRAKAQAGDAQAQVSLGLKFINGADGLKKNPQATEKLWLRAAKQGQLTAQMNLGLLYSRGALGENDPLKAYQWAKLSFQGGHQRAKQLAETLEKELTPEQIAEAEQFIKTFKPVVEEHGDIPAPVDPSKPIKKLTPEEISEALSLRVGTFKVTEIESEKVLETFTGTWVKKGLSTEFRNTGENKAGAIVTYDPVKNLFIENFENGASIHHSTWNPLTKTLVRRLITPKPPAGESVTMFLRKIDPNQNDIRVEFRRNGELVRKIEAIGTRIEKPAEREQTPEIENGPTTHLSVKDVAKIAAQPHQSIIAADPHFVTSALKEGMWERTSKIKVKENPNQEAQVFEQKLRKKIKHVQAKYVVIENTSEKGVFIGTEVHSYDPHKKIIYSTSVNERGDVMRMIGVPNPNKRTVDWRLAPVKNDPFTVDLSITCSKDGLSAQLMGKRHRNGQFFDTITGVLTRIGDLPEGKKLGTTVSAKPKLTQKQILQFFNEVMLGEWTGVDKDTGEVVEKFTMVWHEKNKSVKANFSIFEEGKITDQQNTSITTYDPKLDLFVEKAAAKNGQPESIKHFHWNPIDQTMTAEVIKPKPEPGTDVKLNWKKTDTNVWNFNVRVFKNGEKVYSQQIIQTRKAAPVEK